jgi:hypothetical protein
MRVRLGVLTLCRETVGDLAARAAAKHLVFRDRSVSATSVLSVRIAGLSIDP